MYQRTMKVTITSGEMPDLMLRLDSEVAPLAQGASGFIGYYAVATDETTLVTTRIFEDRASLEAETHAAGTVSDAIFGFSFLEVMVDGPFGVARGFGPIGPIEEFTP